MRVRYTNRTDSDGGRGSGAAVRGVIACQRGGCWGCCGEESAGAGGEALFFH